MSSSAPAYYPGSGAGSAATGDGARAGVEAALSRLGLVAVLDVCVALYKFVNVELHSQGWYAVRVRVLPPGPAAVCVPHSVIQSGGMTPGGADPRRQGWVVEPAACSLRSPVFRVRYCYEEVKLQMALLARVYVPNLQSLPSLDLQLEYELLFQEADMDNPSAVPEEFALKVVARERVTLAGAAGGAAEYFGCTFSDEHFGLAASGLFAGLAGFATRDSVPGLAPKGAGGGAGAAGGSGGGWLCHLVVDGRRGVNDSAQYTRLGPEGDPSATIVRLGGLGAPDGGLAGTGAGASGAGGAAGAPKGAGAGASPAPGPAPGPDFGEEEARKRLIKLLHDCVEAPGATPHGAPAIPSEPQRQERLAAAYAATVGAAAAARDRLAAGLRSAPPECFAPQNLDVLRTLLGQGAALGGAGGSCGDGAGPGGGGGGGGGAGAAARLDPAGAASLRTATPRASAAATLNPLLPHPSSPHARSHPSLAPAHSLSAPLSARPSPHRPANPTTTPTSTSTNPTTSTATAPATPPLHVPSVSEFRAALASGAHPTTAAALAAMDGLLAAIAQHAATDWAVLCWVLRSAPRELLRHLKAAWERAQPDAVLPFIVWDAACGRDAIAAIAAAHRARLRGGPPSPPSFPPSPAAPSPASWHGLLPRVRAGSAWGAPGEQPVLVVDDTQGVKWTEERETYFGKDFRPRDEAHVAIFVHGFQGAATDLCLVRAHLMLQYPYLECFASKTNEGNTHDSLAEMGKRLAVEVAEFLAPFARSSRRPLRKITLVGHSIGNLILRSALTQPELAPYLPLLWLYLSLAGPHAGFLYGSNAVVDTGLALLKSVGKGKCLHQLTFSDAPALPDCYLARLAGLCPLTLFKLVVVVASPQDRYVPYHSASLTSCPQAERDSRRGRCYADMLRALLGGAAASVPGPPGPIGPGTHLFRVSVDFCLRGRGFSLSKLVGRTAHIEFIEGGAWVGLLLAGLVARYGMLAPAQHAWL